MEISKMEDAHEVVDADPGLDPQLFQQQICNLLGLPSSIPKSKVIEQLMGGLIPNTPENQESINFVLAHVAAHSPGSLLEAQLIVQLLATHQLCTRMLRKADRGKWEDSINQYTNIAMKLSRGYLNGLGALARYRRNENNTCILNG